jgi:hypothetical protein
MQRFAQRSELACSQELLTTASIYAVHQVRDGWEIIAPDADPTTPAYWRVGVIRQHGWRAAGRDRDGNAPMWWDQSDSVRALRRA